MKMKIQMQKLLTFFHIKWPDRYGPENYPNDLKYSTLSEVAAPQPAGRGQGLLRREGEARGEEGGHQEDPLPLRVHSSPSSPPSRHCVWYTVIYIILCAQHSHVLFLESPNRLWTPRILVWFAANAVHTHTLWQYQQSTPISLCMVHR